jgi:hypothetical protein
MPLIKNKKTGGVWDITNPDLLKRIRAVPLEYEEIAVPTTEPVPGPKPKNLKE